MVTIIYGDKGQGKTLELLRHFREHSGGDGFVSDRVLEGERTIGYDVRHLRTGRALPLARDVRHLPAGWVPGVRHGRFDFSQAALGLAADVLREAIASGAEPLYMDEIGKLELQGGGFADLLREALSSGRELVITTRETNVEPVIAAFGIEEHRLVRAPRPG